jgi:hypothetical protein
VAEVAESVGGMVVAVEVSDILVFELLIDGLLGLAIPQTIEPEYLLEGGVCSWHQVRG